MSRPKTTIAKSAIRSRAGNLIRSVSSASVLLSRQIWVYPILAAVVLGTLGWFLRGAIEAELKRDLVSELETIRDADVAALELWLQSERAAASAIAENPAVVRLVRALVGNAAAADVGTAELLRATELGELRTELESWMENHGYDGFAVVDRNLRVIAAMRDEPIGLDVAKTDGKPVLEYVLAGNATVTRPFPSVIPLPGPDGSLELNVPTMFAAAPVDGEGDEVAAALMLRIRPEDEFTRILQVAQPGSSGETYAFDAEGLMISRSRFEDDLQRDGLLGPGQESILTLQVRDPGVDVTLGNRPDLPLAERPLTRSAADAIAGHTDVDVEGYRDYRGVPVIGAWTWLPDVGFGVVTELDVEEAYRPLNMMRGFFFGMFSLLTLAALAIFVFTVVVARANRAARHAALEARQLGQYRLDEKLGEGGMGVVYRAHHAMLHRPTAVKFLDVEKTNDQTIARFEREVQITSQLVHPNTIAVYDYGRTPEGIFYYAMELLEGIDLDDLVATHGPVSEGRAINLLRQICGSLSEAHASGLVHRDVKPANAFVCDRGGIPDFVKLLDFGLVKAVDTRKQASLTSAGSITGTPMYLAPEAIEREQSVDSRADLYAVGAVGYFLVTGQPPFDGDSVLDILRKQVESDPVPPSQRTSQPLSPEFEQAILRCLRKDPEERPQQAEELVAELQASPAASEWSRAEARVWWNDHRNGHDPRTKDGTRDETIVVDRL